MTDESFRIVDGNSQRRNSEGVWVDACDPAQPNPSYVENPGIHGWNGVTIIDIAPDVAPGDEVTIPSIEVTAEAAKASTERDFQVGVSSMDIPVIKVGPHVAF